MTIVEAAEVRQRLTMPVCIDLMRTSLRELEAGNYTQPLRSIALLPGGEKFGFMPACLGDCFGAKVLSAFPQNAGTKYPSHIGYVLLFEGEHGSFLGMADAAVITEIRTGAVSGVATDLLARPDAHRLAIIGAGAQGRSHLAAMTVVRDIHSVTVYDQNTQTARRYCQEMEEKFGIPVTAADSVREAVCDADIVCTVTPSREPYLESDWIAPGTHINAVGAAADSLISHFKGFSFRDFLTAGNDKRNGARGCDFLEIIAVVDLDDLSTEFCQHAGCQGEILGGTLHFLTNGDNAESRNAVAVACVNGFYDVIDAFTFAL